MKIIKLTNSFTIENKGSITQHALNTVTAYIGQLRDSVTFKDAAQNIGSAPVEEITVNGEQMKSDNIETLLEELFFLSVNKEQGTGSFVQQQVNWIEDNAENVSFIKNRPYTRVEYSDPLVFPKPIRSGHVIEFYKDEVLYSTYQWNGWNWVVMGAEPNFIFTPTKDSNSKLGLNVVFSSLINGKYNLTLDENLDNSDASIYASNIILSNKNIRFGVVDIRTDANDKNLNFSNITSNTLSINNSGYDNIQESVVISECKSNNLAIALSAQNLSIDNVGPIDNSSPLIVANGTNINVKNSITDNINISCVTADSIKVISNIHLLDNISSLGENGELSITINGNSEYSPNDCNITIKNNVGLTSLNITGFVGDSSILSMDLNLLNTLRFVDISNCNFSQESFDNLINSITSMPKNEGVFKRITLTNTIPVITDTKKQELIDLGWNVNI